MRRLGSLQRLAFDHLGRYGHDRGMMMGSANDHDRIMLSLVARGLAVYEDGAYRITDDGVQIGERVGTNVEAVS